MVCVRFGLRGQSLKKQMRRTLPEIEPMERRALLSQVQLLDEPGCQMVDLSQPIPNPVNTDGRLNPGNSHGEADGRYGGSRSNSAGHHQGIDITAPAGTKVHSVESGTVIFSGYKNSTDGYQVKVYDQDGTIAIYDHLQSSGIFKLPRSRGHQKPVNISAGTVLGRVGRTGNVPRGAETHLHFQMFDSDLQEIVPDIDPENPDRLVAPGYCIDRPQAPAPTPTPAPTPSPTPSAAPILGVGPQSLSFTAKEGSSDQRQLHFPLTTIANPHRNLSNDN
jgi:murein DD-endopeptidase MepM/ murein hydrolase activator NlpD